MIYLYRISHWLCVHRIPILPRLLYALNRMVFAIGLPPGVKVGKDVLFGYSGLGIMVHARVVNADRIKIGASNVGMGNELACALGLAATAKPLVMFSASPVNAAPVAA
jgi:serine O-acetyltransferase